MKEPTRMVGEKVRLESNALVRVFQLFYLLIGGLAYLRMETLDALVLDSWSYLKTTWFFQHDSFEPVVATSFFAIWIHFFWFVDDVLPLKQFIINPKSRVKDYKTGIPEKAALAYLIPLLLFDFFYPRRTMPEFGPGSFFKVGTDIVKALALYDLIFFPIHFLMHRVKWLRGLHEKHHTCRSGMWSVQVLQHSMVDGALQVATNIATLKILGLHPYTRMWYNIVVTYLLCEIHCGYDLPWAMNNVLPVQIYGGAPRHETHHRVGTRYYQQFFTYIDDLLEYLIKS